MSGIAGVFGKAADAELTTRMLDKLTHRGPDKVEIVEGPGYVVGCCEQGLGARASRALAYDERVALAVDGLIDNERPADVPDVEVLKDLYHRDGHALGPSIDGTFALAVAREGELFLLRDHVGARSLFYGERDGVTCFASELKALSGLVDEVTELPAGRMYSTRDGLRDYAPFVPEVPDAERPEQAKRVLRDLLIRATEAQMADGAVGGSGMSGGLDSSVIAAIAVQIQPDLPLFTVGIEGSEDLENARRMAAHLGAQKRHHVLKATEEDVENLVRDAIYFLESFEEDCVSGTIANLLTSSLAAEHTNCSLSGEGSDELFGGYHLLKTIPDPVGRQRMMERLVAIAWNTALRRLDRGWMAHSVQYRTPFLDNRVIAFSRKIPVEWKIHGPEQTEKWIVREAFRDLLPREIADRRKLRFAAGAGVDDLMDRIAARHVRDTELQDAPLSAGGYALSSPKELWYYRIFREHFPSPGFESQVARWDPHKP